MGFEKEIEANRDLALRAGQVQDAIDALLALERAARLAGDITGTTELCVAIVKICHDANQWTLLNESIQLISKRRAQLKQVRAARARQASRAAAAHRMPRGRAAACRARADLGPPPRAPARPRSRRRSKGSCRRRPSGWTSSRTRRRSSS